MFPIFRRRHAASHQELRINIKGTTRAVGEGTPFYIIDGDDKQCYEPTELPRMFRDTGIRVKIVAERQINFKPAILNAQVIKILRIEHTR